MKIVVSDIHCNRAAINALPEETYDQLWRLGDIVDYRPWPHEAIRRVRSYAQAVVCRNHDHAVGFAVAPESSMASLGLAEVTRQYMQRICTSNDMESLRELPLRKEVVVHGTKFHFVHALPSDPLFGYLPEDPEQWNREVERMNPEFLLLSYTHPPSLRRIGPYTIVNRGSPGQPKTGCSLACYAVWEDGQVVFKEYEYRIEKTMAEIVLIAIPDCDRRVLISTLMYGADRPMPNEIPVLPHEVEPVEPRRSF